MMVESTKKRDRERKGTEKSKTRVLISIEVEKLGKKKKKIYKKKKIEYEKKRTYPGISI